MITRFITGAFFSLTLLVASAPIASASTFTGTVSTGVSTGIEGTVIVAPTASPNAGVYTVAQTVTLSASGSSSIRYTIDGTTPNCSSGTVYATPVVVSTSEVIIAIACYSNGTSSSATAFQYAINPSAAALNGGGGGGGSISTPVVNSAGISGDTNADGKVDVLDFNILIVNWTL